MESTIIVRKEFEGIRYEAFLITCHPHHVEWELLKPIGWAGRRFSIYITPQWGVGWHWFRVPLEQEESSRNPALGMRDSAILYIASSLQEFHEALQYAETHLKYLRSFFESFHLSEAATTRREEKVNAVIQKACRVRRELKQMRKQGEISDESFQFLSDRTGIYLRYRKQNRFNIRFEREGRLKKEKERAGIPLLIDEEFLERYYMTH